MVCVNQQLNNYSFSLLSSYTFRSSSSHFFFMNLYLSLCPLLENVCFWMLLDQLVSLIYRRNGFTTVDLLVRFICINHVTRYDSLYSC